MRPPRALLASGAAALVAALATTTPAPASAVDTPPGSAAGPGFADFYVPPADLTSLAPANGDVIRTEPFPLAPTVAGLPGPIPARTELVMFRSTGAAGGPVPVTGAVLRSTRPWTGRGPRPLAVLAPGTHGQGDQCAASKGLRTMVSVQTSPPSVDVGYELLSAWALTDAGFDVVVPDYEGLGTPGTHTYVDRTAEGHAVLDAARAAIRLAGAGGGPDTPAVFTGYSQGGGAAAAAAELAAGYAPDLRTVGANASAPPADKLAVLARIDGSLISGAIGYAVNGYTASHPELAPLVHDALNDRGRAMLRTVSEQCLGDTILGFGLQTTSAYTVDGRPVSAVLAEIPEVMRVLEDQRIGRIRPSVPVRLQGNVNDDAVGFAQVEDLAREWCGSGATVDFRVDATPPVLPRSALTHFLPLLTHQQEVVGYLLDRVDGAPAPNTCGGASAPAAGSTGA